MTSFDHLDWAPPARPITTWRTLARPRHCQPSFFSFPIRLAVISDTPSPSAFQFVPRKKVAAATSGSCCAIYASIASQIGAARGRFSGSTIAAEAAALP